MAELPTLTADWAVAPGEILLEALEDRGWSQAELARRLDRPLKTVNEIVKGKAAITPTTAIQLERVLGISARLWTSLEAEYRHALAAAADRADLASSAQVLKRFPIQDLRRRGHITADSSDADTLHGLLRFFGVNSVTAWQRQWAAMPALRESQAFQSAPEALACWLRLGQLQAEQAHVRRYDAKAFVAAIDRIRTWTRQAPFRLVLDKLVSACAHAGVVVVLVPELTGTHIAGATYRTPHGTYLLQLSLRYKTDDQFWFTFFHEAAHILRGHGDLVIDLPDMQLSDERAQQEDQADSFARTTLLADEAVSAFVAGTAPIDAALVRAFAKEQNVAPGIVVGRLQHDGVVAGSQLNHLKRKVDFNQ